jgi:hypothetical protein
MPRIPRRWKGEQPVEPTPPDAHEPEPGREPSQQQTSEADRVAPAPPAVEQPTSVIDSPPSGADAPATTVVAPEGATVVASEAPSPGESAGHAAMTEPGDVVAAEQAPPDATPRFRERTRMRRRLRYLRRLRELAFRDLGGLVFDLHRFGRERADLVTQKLDALSRIDGELRTLEGALRDRRELTELREPGIAACPRCQTLHDTDANFCPGCGAPLRGRAPSNPTAVSVAPADAEHQTTATAS